MIIAKFLGEYRNEVSYKRDRKEIYEISRKYIGGTDMGLHKRIFFKFEDSLEFEKLTGLVFSLNNWQQYGVRSSPIYNGPSFRVQNLRLVSRIGPQGNQMNNIVFSLVQRAGIKIVDQELETYVPDDFVESPKTGFEFWGGCTMIFDLDTLQLRYAIAKPLLDPDKLRQGHRAINTKRARAQYRYQTEEGLMHLSEQSLYFGTGLRNYFNEPFAFLHSH